MGWGEESLVVLSGSDRVYREMWVVERKALSFCQDQIEFIERCGVGRGKPCRFVRIR